MLRIALCDDMPVYTQELQHLLEHWDKKPTTFNIEVFDNGDELLQAHIIAPFDIIFLDVVMPLLNGIETAKELRQHDKTVRIVFISSEKNYAVDSYSVKADNYLLKPVNIDALYTCVQELYEELQSHAKTITLHGATATYHVALNNIEYIEAQNKHVLFYLLDGKILQANQPLYSFEEKLVLQDGFYKCHRSYVANIHHISAYTATNIQFRSGRQVPISRGSYKAFESAYFDFLFGKVGER